jgi:hypothetical protein
MCLGRLLPCIPSNGHQCFGEGLESEKVVGLPNLSNLIFDAVRKSTIEGVMERVVTLLDLGSQAIEGHHVFGNLLAILHLKVFKLRLSRSDRIRRSEVCFELLTELGIVIEEDQ